MKYLLIALFLVSPAVAQTPQVLKSLMFNTNSGQVIATTGTNALKFTNSVTFSEVTVTNTFYPPTFASTNLFAGAGSLRMTGSSSTTRLVYKLLGVSPADRTVLAAEDNLSGLNSAATARTNLGLGATWLTNTTAANFRTAIGLGDANSNVKFNSLILGGENSAILSTTNWFGPYEFFAPAAKFYAIEVDGFVLTTTSGNLTLYTALYFDTATNAAITRTNLGLGLPALTNTSVTNFQSAIFATNSAPTNTTTVSAWTTIQIGTNAYRVPLYR